MGRSVPRNLMGATLSRTVKSLKLYPTCKLACCTFMGAAKKTRDSWVGEEGPHYSRHSSISIPVSSPLGPLSHGCYRDGCRGIPAYAVICIIRGPLSLGNPNLSCWAVTKPLLCSRKRHYLYFQGCSLYKTPLKSQYLCLQDMQK